MEEHPAAIDPRFDGRTAIITGAASGLGREYALSLGRRGANVVLSDLNESGAKAVAREISSVGGQAAVVTGSVSEPAVAAAIIDAAFASYGGVDILIANAGTLCDRTFLKMTTEELDSVLGVHLNGTAYVVHAAWPHLLRSTAGRVVLTTSAAGLWGNFGQANYSAAKLGIVGLMHTLRLEGDKYSIKTNTVAPFAVTVLGQDVFREDLRPHLTTRDVGALVLWLCSQECCVSGEVFEVGGGRIARARLMRTDGVVLPPGFGPGDVARSMPEIFAQPLDRSYGSAWDDCRDFLDHISADAGPANATPGPAKSKP